MGSTAFEKANIEVRSPQPGVALVVLAGEHDLYSGDELRQILEASLACCDHLIVDLSAAEFIDSTIIHVLLQTMRSATELDRKFHVVLGTAPAVERILEVTGVIRLLGVVPTVEQALAAERRLGTVERPATCNDELRQTSSPRPTSSMTRDESALAPSAPA